MPLNDKVQRAVDLAFTKVDSLLKTAVFSNKSSSSFNFANSAVVAVNTQYTTRGLLQNKKYWANGSTITKLTLLLKTGGIVFSGYTTVVIDGGTYSCSVMEGDAFITTLELVGAQ